MDTDPRIEAVRGALIVEGADAGSSIHGWRCEYPDRYGPCDCVTQAARAIVAALDTLDEGSDLALMLQRERIAQEIEADVRVNAHACQGDPSCSDCSYAAGLSDAVRIARGQS